MPESGKHLLKQLSGLAVTASPLICFAEESALRKMNASENHQRNVHKCDEQCSSKNALSGVLHVSHPLLAPCRVHKHRPRPPNLYLGRCRWSLPTPTLWVNYHPLLTGFAEGVAIEPLPSSRSLPNTTDATADVGGLPTLFQRDRKVARNDLKVKRRTV